MDVQGALAHVDSSDCGGPGTGIDREGVGSRGRFLNGNPPPAFPRPHPPVSADSPSIRGGASSQGIGRPGGGLTSRAVAVVDALGHLVRFTILPGQAHDLKGVPELPGGLAFGAFVGDRASGADRLLEDLAERGAEAVTRVCGSGPSAARSAGKAAFPSRMGCSQATTCKCSCPCPQNSPSPT